MIFPIDNDLSLNNSSSQAYISYLEDCLQADTHGTAHIILPSIPSTVPLNNPKTIQIPSSLVDSSLVSYAVLLILHGLKYFLSFSGWLSMTLVIFGLILNMFGSVLTLMVQMSCPSIIHIFTPIGFSQLLIVFLV